MSEPLRIGILGAAGIAPDAVVHPARTNPDVEVVAIAARSHERAEAFAAEHGVPSAEPSYEAVLGRPDVDAVYAPLPVSLHRAWCERALRAGKHVLCEKPMTMNAGEAQGLVTLADQRGLVLAQAFHYRYHPLMTRLLDIVTSGEVGDPEHVEAVFLSRLPRNLTVYWDPRLGGGTRHDICYPVHCVRTVMGAVTGAEPEVVGASAEWLDGVDSALDAQLRFGTGARGRIRAKMTSPGGYENWLRLLGSNGELFAENFALPHLGGDDQPVRPGSIEISTAAGTRRETFPATPTYVYQLAAFVDAVRHGVPMPTSGADIVGNARLLDAMLAAASPGGSP